jgi:threonylcarbamoyladenosine tRNA methylthiotransferase MtaB
MPGFHVEHFGCRAARADGEAVSDRLRAAGHCMQQLSEADVVVVNTCSVTAEADRAARAFIRRAHRLNPEARIVVTGCYAQRAPEELAVLPGVAAVVGNSHKALAPEIVLGLAKAGPGKIAPRDIVPVQSLLAGGAPIWADDRFAHSFLEEAQLTPGAQTRPNLKIQEGCGNRCTFCVIPQTRGSSKSLPAPAVLRQVEGFVGAGGNELVLSGINLGRWGWDLPDVAGGDGRVEAFGLPALRQELNRGSFGSLRSLRMTGHGVSLGNLAPRRLAALVRAIFEKTALPRLRLSSIEPMDWDAELIGLMAEFGGTRLARHAHLPLQSGSDGVLRRMHRRYRPWHYAEKVAALVEAAGPELTLGADVMVGFPGETDAEFEETLAFIRALPFGYLHLFPFSPRPGTPGWAMHAERPVPAGAVAERMAALRELASEKSETHRRRSIGKELEVITLHTPAELAARGRTAALAENFLPVEIEGKYAANRLMRVQVTGLNTEVALEATTGRSIANAPGFLPGPPLNKTARSAKPSQCYT